MVANGTSETGATGVAKKRSSRSQRKDIVNERNLTNFEGKREMWSNLPVGWVATHWRVALHLGSPLARRRMPGNASSSGSVPGVRGQYVETIVWSGARAVRAGRNQPIIRTTKVGTRGRGVSALRPPRLLFSRRRSAPVRGAEDGWFFEMHRGR